jgi:phenylacetate-CoA ligase
VLPGLKELRLFGEVVDDEVRSECVRAWDVRTTDAYSANEVGYIALQCPDGPRYHVQSESLLVEVLRDDGGPCGPGETGRVVLTTLHNLAMPLIRYDIGDYAEVGPPCPCGRGLPVLRRILGRTRNMLRLPTGEARWPVPGAAGFRERAPVRQYQVIQTTLTDLLLRLVVERPLTGEEEALLREKLVTSLGYPFRVSISYHTELERSPSLKFEEFKSLVGPV